MGRPLFTPQNSTPTIVAPDEEPVTYPSYAKWSYENAFDPDSEDFFMNAIEERPLKPDEECWPSLSSDSSASSSGRGTPDDTSAGRRPTLMGSAGLPQPPLSYMARLATVLPSEYFAVGDTTGAPAPRRRSASDAGRTLEPGAVVSHYAAMYDTASQEALQRMQARQRAVRLDAPPALDAPSDDGSEEWDDFYPVRSRAAVWAGSAHSTLRVPGGTGMRDVQMHTRVHTSDITPIPLPSTVARYRLPPYDSGMHSDATAVPAPAPQSQAQPQPVPVPSRPFTPPAQGGRGQPPQQLTPEEQSSLMQRLSPSPPPSISPHFYSWGPPPQRPQVLASPSPAPGRPRWPPVYE